MKGSVRQILAGKLALGEFDFVYAAGLFDYLSQPVAKALVKKKAKHDVLISPTFSPSGACVYLDSGLVFTACNTAIPI